jgi:Fanconi-associated nuclease 1
VFSREAVDAPVNAAIDILNEFVLRGHHPWHLRRMSLLHYWETQRSVKRRRTSEKDTDLETNLSEKRPPSPSPSSGVADTSTPVPIAEESGAYIPSSQTELETSLPVIQTDEDAIKAYEASQTEKDAESEQGLHVRLRDGVWQRGKSSIYVDAFNLALETVLDEESHLFNEAEMEVFQQWKNLSYESQYL